MLRSIAAAASFAAMLFVSAAPAAAQSRVALVIGNSAYAGAPPLRTSVADADLIAATLQGAGFDIVRANDVTTANFGDTIAAFLDKVSAAGPNAVAFVYFAGYGVQYDGDSYLVPVDTRIDRAEDTPNATMSLSSVMQALGQVPAAARIIVLDAARDGGFGNAGGSPVAPGLALVGVPPGFLLAYPAAPGTNICDCADDAPNSPYASSLATLLRQPGLEIDQVFDGVRLQINQASGGTQVPWMVSALGVEVRLFQATAEAPQTFLPALGVENIPVPPPVPVRWTRERYRELSADEAYRIAIERDSLETYQWFVETYPTYPLAGQIWRIIEWRRDAILWHRALVIGTVAGYWNYLDAYPDGLYARQARYWLERHGAPMVPQGYAPVFFELPPGYVDEAVGLPILVERGRPVPRYFGNVQSVYIEQAPRWTPPARVAIAVRPPPPPPPPALIVREARFAPRPPGGVQPVQPVFNPSLNPLQQQQKQRELAAWQTRVNQQQQAVARQYHAPVVTQTSIVLPPANAGVQQKPAGIQIPNKPGLTPPANNGNAAAPGGTQHAVVPPPNRGLTIPNAKPAPNGTQRAVIPPPQQTPGGTSNKPGAGGVQRAVVPPPQQTPGGTSNKPGAGGVQRAVVPPPQQQAPAGANAKPGGGPPNNNAAEQQRLQQERAAQEKAAQEKAAQERAALERQRQQQKPVQPPKPPQPPQQAHPQQPAAPPPKPPQPPQQAHQQQPAPQPPKPPQPPQPPQQAHPQQPAPPPPKPPQPPPQQAHQQPQPQPQQHPPACPAGEHMVNGKCVR
jgi:hypothetical protein